MEQIIIPPELLQGDYNNDPEFRADFQDWISAIWQDKDQLITQIKKEKSLSTQKTLSEEIETA